MDRSPASGSPGAEAAELSALRDLVERAPCGYLTCGDDGVVTWVNQTFLRWTGHRRDALVGSKLADLLPVGDRVLWATSCVPRLRTTGSVAEVVLEVLTADGSRRAVLVSATRHDGGGAGGPQVKVVVFGVHERAQQQKSLVDTLHRAREAEQQRTTAEAQVRRLKAHDPLTGLRNRRGFIDALEAALREGPRAPTAVLVVDVDHFKTVNDSLGHAAGDELLTVVARRLSTTVGADGSQVARLAGDEFAVMAQVFGDDDGGAIAQRILDAVGEPTTVDGLEIVVSAGIGVARVAAGENAEQVMRRAGAAVYRAKAHGPNTVRVHDPEATDPAANRLRTLGELRRGIDRGELRVHYQPRVLLGDGALCGVEALVRWQHPQHGLLSPDRFIDVAETSGLIHRLGAAVLDEAVAQAARWADGGHPVEVAVNLSARQLVDPSLAGAVAATLSRHGLDPALLTLEVTETALVTDPDTAAATLQGLKELGVVLSVDDFGTGYASLTYLQQFPLDELKIDRSFVASLPDDETNAAIVAACVKLAGDLGLRSVAEGVETREQRDALLELGCDQAQGYLFFRPVAPEHLPLPSATSPAAPDRAGGLVAAAP